MTLVGISALCGVTATVIAGIVTLALNDTKGLNTEVAVTMTDESLAVGVVGAV